ncbi:hypothetical protein EVAR_84344_1 [Eumeta japonica]|uniref:Uncharacterized protein n=1 Tax=Eumeta variegata TaxID=151549 RepID=A0A4C1U4P5_EUMVA|nr:hypothetical protein EVAR_84344_1 [Eumeta japonica]
MVSSNGRFPWLNRSATPARRRPARSPRRKVGGPFKSWRSGTHVAAATAAGRRARASAAAPPKLTHFREKPGAGSRRGRPAANYVPNKKKKLQQIRYSA